MASIFVVNSFADVKLKSSGGGGFSDGGILSLSVTLPPAGVVEIAPPKGVNFGGVTMSEPAEQSELGGVLCCNFDLVSGAFIQELFVSADGTETIVTNIGINPGGYGNVSDFFEGGGILSYPNKLRYRFFPGKGTPTARVLLKQALMLYDRPADQG